MSSARPDAPPVHGIIQDETGCQTMLSYVVDTGQPDEKARAWLKIEPRHTNRSGHLHGGLMATLLDAASGFTASMMLGDGSDQTPVITVSLTVNYVGAVRVGNTVTATGHGTGGGRKIAYVNGELHDETGRLVATSTGVFRKVSAWGTHDTGTG